VLSFFVEIPSSHLGGKIVIREQQQHIGTPSSCESIFVDAFSSPVSSLSRTFAGLNVTKLEQFDIVSESHNESLNAPGGDATLNEMPIVKNGNGQSDAADKGMFNVSRIKKVELSEIPLDIASARKFIIPLILLTIMRTDFEVRNEKTIE
jgi:hypothetical protein